MMTQNNQLRSKVFFENQSIALQVNERGIGRERKCRTKIYKLDLIHDIIRSSINQNTNLTEFDYRVILMNEISSSEPLELKIMCGIERRQKNYTSVLNQSSLSQSPNEIIINNEMNSNICSQVTEGLLEMLSDLGNFLISHNAPTDSNDYFVYKDIDFRGLSQIIIVVLIPQILSPRSTVKLTSEQQLATIFLFDTYLYSGVPLHYRLDGVENFIQLFEKKISNNGSIPIILERDGLFIPTMTVRYGHLVSFNFLRYVFDLNKYQPPARLSRVRTLIFANDKNDNNNNKK